MKRVIAFLSCQSLAVLLRMFRLSSVTSERLQCFTVNFLLGSSFQQTDLTFLSSRLNFLPTCELVLPVFCLLDFWKRLCFWFECFFWMDLCVWTDPVNCLCAVSHEEEFVDHRGGSWDCAWVTFQLFRPACWSVRCIWVHHLLGNTDSAPQLLKSFQRCVVHWPVRKINSWVCVLPVCYTPTQELECAPAVLEVLFFKNIFFT